MLIALAINELATNALKYGALSNETGRIRINWTVGHPGRNDAFELSWRESGGPAVSALKRKGFGSTILEKALSADFMGKACLRHNQEGVQFALVTKMQHIGRDKG